MSETANLHLQLPGEMRTVEVLIPEGEQTVTALFPAARAIAHAIVDHAVANVEREGRRVSCCAGCGACCRQLVVISLAEAEALARLVEAMPEERQRVIRQRFADAVAGLEKAGLLNAEEPRGNRHLLVSGRPGSIPLAVEYFRLRIACPFLEDESCSIHVDRPLVCREYLVTSPAERCAHLFEVPVERIEITLHVTDALIRTIDRVTGAGEEAIPLVLALEWAEHHGNFLSQKEDGLAMLRILVEEVQNGQSK